MPGCGRSASRARSKKRPSFAGGKPAAEVSGYEHEYAGTESHAANV